jgi:hypothetical protein
VQRWLADPQSSPPQVHGFIETRSLVAFLRHRRRADESKDATHYRLNLPGLRPPKVAALPELLSSVAGAVEHDGTTVPRSERYGRGNWTSRGRW